MSGARGTNDMPRRDGRLRRLKKGSSAASGPDWRVAIDFGTTNTSIAFSSKTMASGALHTIDEFPGDLEVDRAGTQVPTEIAYQLNASTRSVLLGDGRSVLYGYQIRRTLEQPDNHDDRIGYNAVCHVRKAKLLLDDSSDYLKGLKSELSKTLKVLTTKYFIEEPRDVITDILICFFQHSKSILTSDYGFDENDTVELTFTVPVCWTASANMTMSKCIEEAMGHVRFGSNGTGPCNLFMVNEAEAAAMYVITSDFCNMKRGETFVLIDCGGGTTEAGIYTIANQKPLRLGSEVVHPIGEVCGSDNLNERFRKFATDLLSNELYLLKEDENDSIANLVETELMHQFESKVKRSFKISDKTGTFSFRLRFLRKSKHEHRLQSSALLLTYEDMLAIFMPSLVTIAGLMDEQIAHGLESNTEIDKVVLVGGFGDSPGLKEYLRERLAQINKSNDLQIALVHAPPCTGAAGVAKGALMRAWNKKNGPTRIPCQSIGILHHVRDEGEHLNGSSQYPLEVFKQKGRDTDPDTGELYILNTIEWLFKVNEGEVEAVHEVAWPSMHLFNTRTPVWIAEHILYVSDVCTEDFYRRDHFKNKGKANELAIIEFDLSYLKDQILQQTQPREDREDIYEVNILIKLKLIDRHLEFTACWPADEEDSAVVIQGSHKLINAVAALPPGTA